MLRSHWPILAIIAFALAGAAAFVSQGPFATSSAYAAAGDPQTISGIVWNDLNVNQTQELGTNILDQADTAQAGTNLYGDPTSPGSGIEDGRAGVTVCLTGSITVAGVAVVADRCTTTDATGYYEFDLTDIDPTGVGIGKVQVSFDAPQGFRFTSPTPAGDNDATEQAGSPTPPDPWRATISVGYDGTAAAGVTDGTDAGIRPVPEIKLAYLDLNAIPGDGVQGVETGTPSFDTEGNCTSADPLDPLQIDAGDQPPTPGDDCHKFDETVRTNDLVTITPALTMDNAPAGGVDDVILEMQFFPVNGADIEVVSAASSGIPTSCLTSGVSPASSVTKNPDGSIILICNLGNVENAQLFAPISIKPTGNSPNGSSFTTEIRAYAADNDAIPSEELEAPEIAISGAPKFDLTKNSGSATSPFNRVSSGGRSERTNPVTGVLEFGRHYSYDLSVIADGDGKGSLALGSPFTFDEIIDPRYAPFGAHVIGCRNYPLPYSLPQNGNGVTPFSNFKTANSGAWACSNNGSTNTITVTNADTSGVHYPVNGGNGTTTYTTQTAPFKFVSTGLVSVWYPESALYRYTGPDRTLNTADDGSITDPNDPSIWQPGDDIITGTYPTTNCVGNFDPESIADANGDTVSNYGTGLEPGWDGSAATGNNCRNLNMTISRQGSFSKWYQAGDGTGGQPHALSKAPVLSWATYWIPPGQTTYHSGDGPVVGGQNFTSLVYFHAYYSSADLPEPSACETIDNATYKLAPIPSGNAAGDYAFMSYLDLAPPGIDGGSNSLGYVFGTDHGFILEYARFTAASGRTTWQSDHSAGPPNPVDGTLPINNAQQQAAGLDCGRALTASGDLEWSTNQAAFPVDDIVMVRWRSAPGSDQVLQAGDLTRLGLNFEARDTFYSPDFPVEDGQPIPSGTLFPNQSNFAYDRDNDGIGDHSNGSYDATDHKGVGSSSVGYGDRLIFQNVLVSIEKGAYKAFNSPASAVGDDDTNEVFAGDPIMWSLQPAVTGVNNAATAKNLQITDVIPNYASYAASCTPPPPAGVTGPVVIPNTPTAGETTLIWTYTSDIPANMPLAPISFCTNTSAFAPAPIDILNKVKIEASNVLFTPALQEDERAVRLLQRGRFAVRKSVDFPLDFQDEQQLWTLEWANTSDQVPFAPADIIDVFPFNGDGPGALAERETYSSDFLGTIELQAIPPAPEMSGGTTGVHSDTGQWYATCDLASTVNPDASIVAANAIPGGSTTWIAVPAGSTAAPSGTCALADVTAIRWVSEDPILPSESGKFTVDLRADNNQANDIYVNRFTGYTPTFLGKAVKSNEPFVQVIGFSIGDVVWLDVDGDGVFNAGSDIPAPAGTQVELFNAAGVSQGTTTTNADGRYLFEGVTGGQYGGGTTYVAGQFYVEVSGLPIGWAVDGASATLDADPNTDLNEDTDHHTIIGGNGAIRSSGLLELSASIDPDGGVIGDEPTGENIKFLGDPLVRDDVTNLTLDLMLVPQRGDIKVIKKDDEDNLLEDWSFSVISTDTAECPLPTSLTNPALTDTDGEALFEDLMIYGATTGELCEYNVVETIQPGWIQLSQTPSGPHTLDPDVPVEITAVNLEVDAQISIEKSTNLNDADTAAAADWIAIGGAITWEYVVKNDGNVDLADVTVVDDQIGAIDCPAPADADDDGDIDLLLVGTSVTCTATGVAADQTANTDEAYANIGTTTGTPTAPNGDPITTVEKPEATDPSHYKSGKPSLKIEKSTNANDADTPGAADWIAIGSDITWEYVVTNDGTVDLANVAIADDQLGAILCPAAADPEQDGTINLLAAGTNVTCTITVPAAAVDTTALAGGVYKNIATATGTPVDEDGEPITEYPALEANDPSHYFSGVPAIEIVKKTNGNDANTPADADWLAIGDDITWTFEVKNSGTVDLADVVVSDDQLGVIACPAANDADADGDIDLLAAGTTVTCTKTVPAGTVDTTANADQAYANIGKATGTPVDPDGDPIEGYPKPEATDPSHYKAGLPSIAIEKRTDGNDADDPENADWLTIGDPIIWKYAVKNNGTVDLANVVVTDNQGVVVTCPATADTDGDGDIDLLAAGTSVICEGPGVVTDTTTMPDGAYANIGEATGAPVDENGDPITEYDPPKADDPSHYKAGSAGLEIVKKTNANDANTPADADWHLVGETITWTYRVTNTGSVDLADVVITDDQGIAVTCLAIRDTDGDGDIDLLAVGQSVTCTGSGPAVDTTANPDQAYANVGSATGTPVDENGDPITGIDPPTASDPSHYKAGTTGIEVRKDVLNPKTGKWQAADDEGAGIVHEVGTTVEYRITVVNTGTLALDNVIVADPVLPQCAKAIGTLAPGAEVSHTCTHTPVVFGFKNTAAATGTPTGVPQGKVTDTNPAYIRVVRPRLAITKKGPKKAKAGSTITYILEVKNTGNGIARDVVVVDALPSGLVLAANSAQRRALKVAQAQRTKANRDIARLRRSSKSVSTASKARTTRLLKKAITRRNVAKKRVVKLRSRVSNYPFTLVRGNVVWKIGDIKAGKKKRIIVKAKAGKSLKGRIINRAQVGAGNSTRCPVPTAKNAFALRRANAATSCTAKKPTTIIRVVTRVTPAVTG